ncbi:hypothetical protein ONZ45_g12246 [Pleurotus djamor]|nr:hypothetical protein ONZ45_g12246 [Pleurotus djamor]
MLELTKLGFLEPLSQPRSCFGDHTPFKLQEEERERKDNYVPEEAALDVSANVGGLGVDSDTKDLLVALNFADIPVTIVNPVTASQDRPRRERRNVPGAAPHT